MALATRRRPRTKPGLLAEARHVVLPAGIVTSGFPAVQAVLLALRLVLDAWQSGLARCILGKDRHGLYAADTVVISICRQAGKTFTIGCLVFADCIINPGTTTVWTAHRFKVSRETFNELRALAKSPLLAPHIDYDAITTAAGNECIPFRNGSRIVFAARERGAIRGFSKVRRLILDEAQILTESTMADLVPTMNQAANPQIILMGTPPKPADPGEVFTDLRAQALAGDAEGVLYVEFSADPDCDIDDWEAVAQANPSFPKRTPKRAILRLRKLLTNDDDYRREGLGIWAGGKSRRVIPHGSWDDAGDETSLAADRLALGVEAAPDLAWASVALAGQRDDGRWHVELDERRDGCAWLVPYVAALLAANPEIRAVVADAGAPVAALFDEFATAKVQLTMPKVKELGAACTRMLEGVVTGAVVHTRQPQLDAAVAVAGKRKLADTGMWVFARASAASDITPIMAATLALHGAQAATVKRPLKKRSGERRGVVL